MEAAESKLHAESYQRAKEVLPLVRSHLGAWVQSQGQERCWWTPTEGQLLLGDLKDFTYKRSLGRAGFVQPRAEAAEAVPVTSRVFLQKTYYAASWWQRISNRHRVQQRKFWLLGRLWCWTCWKRQVVTRHSWSLSFALHQEHHHTTKGPWITFLMDTHWEPEIRQRSSCAALSVWIRVACRIRELCMESGERYDRSAPCTGPGWSASKVHVSASVQKKIKILILVSGWFNQPHQYLHLN